MIVANESGVPCDTDALLRLAGHLLGALALHPDCDLGITLVGPGRMTDLHVEHMNEPGPTDVLSFPMDELRSAPTDEEPVPGILGDIVLCPDFAAAQAAAAGRTVDEEMQFLVTHGMLHLIGYDHMTDEEYVRMFALQDVLLDGWRSA